MADPNQRSSSSRIDSRAGTVGKWTIEQGVEYLKLVRDTFGSREDVRYLGFLEVMKEYKKGIYDTLEIISFAQVMFEGRYELLMGFNILLPRGYNINSIGKDLPTKLKHTLKSINFTHKIETHLRNDKPCYNSLCDLLDKYARDHYSIDILIEELPIVLQDHPDLLAEIYTIYPETTGEVPEETIEDSETSQKSFYGPVTFLF